MQTLGFGLAGLGRIAEIAGGSGGLSRTGTRFKSHLARSVTSVQGVVGLCTDGKATDRFSG